ncbi:hypothetical protein A2U01_0106300, partial [Trifolium medium]|nr:hypothetical protein [Trifolium medium]
LCLTPLALAYPPEVVLNSLATTYGAHHRSPSYYSF